MENQKILLLITSAEELRTALTQLFQQLPVPAISAKQTIQATSGGSMLNMVSPSFAKSEYHAGEPCPLCGTGKVLISKFKEGAFYCSNFKSGCKWKHNA